MKNIYIYIILAVVLCALLCVLLILYFRKKKNYTTEYDLMEGREFEFFCADLLRKSGFLEVEVTKGSGDYGVDILAEKDGISYAVQCKRYDEPVGVHAVQQVYAGKDYYERMVGVVMSNQYFTKAATDMAVKLKVLLWDRGYLEEMIEE